MSWRDDLRPASFRGVAFFVDSAESGVGRRVALHEYPLRDKPYAEDMGRAARRIGVEAIVIGDGYMRARDALIAALEAPGAGTLVHPYLGSMHVTLIEQARVRESTAEGGMARISLAFVEAGEITFPSATSDTRSVVRAAAVTAKASVLARVSAQASGGGVLNKLRSAAQSVVSGVLSRVSGALSALPFAGAGGIASSVTSLAGSVSSGSVFGSSSALSLMGAVAKVRSLASPRAAISALKSVAKAAVVKAAFGIGG